MEGRRKPLKGEEKTIERGELVPSTPVDLPGIFAFLGIAIEVILFGDHKEESCLGLKEIVTVENLGAGDKNAVDVLPVVVVLSGIAGLSSFGTPVVEGSADVVGNGVIIKVILRDDDPVAYVWTEHAEEIFAVGVEALL